MTCGTPLPPWAYWGGLGLPVIGAILGHKHAATTARYAHLSADPIRAANDMVGRRIAMAMKSNVGGGETTTGKIVQIPEQPRRVS